METVAPAIFDPYHKWLGIRDYLANPNPYRLLGLDLFESDEEVVREAASRQSVHLRTYRLGPHRDDCQRILNEIAQAKNLLLDKASKEKYDRSLKTQAAGGRAAVPLPNSERMQAAVTQRGPVAIGHGSMVECPGCNLDNAPTRQFCTGCGMRLWEPCLTCGEYNSASEKHCGQCGNNLEQQLAAAREKMQRQFEAVNALRAESRHAEAIDFLLALEIQDHSGLGSFRERIQESIADLQQELNRAEQEREQALVNGRQLFEASDYEQAALTLERVAPSYRTDEIRALLEQVRTRQVDMLSLVADIRTALSTKQTDGLLDKVEQLLLIKPDHDQARVLAEKLRPLDEKRKQGQRDALYKSAVAQVAAYNYQAAVERLERIPDEERTPKLVQYLEEVRAKSSETLWLVNDLREAVIYDETLLPVAERLQKLRPADPEVGKIIERLRPRLLNVATVNGAAQNDNGKETDQDGASATDTDRSTSAETNGANGHAKNGHAANGTAAAYAKPTWPKTPATSFWGPQLQTITRFRRIDCKKIDDQAFRASPDRFCVAAGLALQGLERCLLQVNLLPTVKTGLLGGLFKGRKRANATAWGIDQGRASLKAIKLTYVADKDCVVAEAAFCIDHAKILNQPDVDSAELLRATLKKLVEKVDKTDFAAATVCLSVPAQKVLVRSIALPTIDVKKIPELMRFEAQQQIPFPIDEVVWGFQILSQHDTEHASGMHECDVVLLAARRDEIKASLAPFAEVNLRIDVVQTDAAALFNFVTHDTATAVEAAGINKVPVKTSKPTDQTTANSKANDDLPEQTEKADDDANEVTLIVDVGTDSTNLIVTNGRSVVMRAIPVGGNAFSRTLVKDFNLTFAQAEKLKRTPTAARELHRLYAALDPRLADLVRETHRSVDSFNQVDPLRQLKRFYYFGGGLRMHGALRKLWRAV